MKICLSCEGVTNTQQQRCGHCGAFLLPTEAVHYPVRRGEVDSGNPLLGTVVDGKYRLQSVLGRGGLGTVFQAMHIGSLMTVALKLLHPRFSERPEYRRALLPEARRAATVTHTRCARLLDVGEAEEGVAYLAMELAEGQTLEALVRGGRLAPSHAVDVLIQVAEALEAIHAVGLVHCDLSPRNVMVAASGGELRVKVLDFGIARSVTLAGASEARIGEFAGFVNPAFSAPELLAGDDVDPRADLYSFGTLAWLLLTGSLPIDDTDAHRTALAVQAGELRPWPAVSGVPRRLQRLVQRCMAADREARPPSAAAVRHQLLLVRGARRPAIARAALATGALAVMATLAVTSDSPRIFLQPLPDSALLLSERAPPASVGPQELTSARLATFGCHFGGFRAQRLRIDISRNGIVLLQMPVQPVVDQPGGTLTLSTAQPEWLQVVQSLLSCSKDGPVDVSFVVPGLAMLGTTRVRLDDERPQVGVHLEGDDGDVLTGRTQLVWESRDDVAVAEAAVEVSFADGRSWREVLPAASGTMPLGTSIAKALGSVEALGAGKLLVRARDAAGNQAASTAITFSAADVASPEVTDVTGPAGEPFVPCIGALANLRVRLSAEERGCRLVLVSAEGAELATVPLAGAGLWHKVELPLVTPAGRLASGPMSFCVVDAAGNRTERTIRVTLRDRDLRLEFAAEGAGVKWVGRELVMAEGGAAVTATLGPMYRLVRASLELTTADGTRDAGELLRLETHETAAASLHFGALPPGSHALRLELQEGDGEQGPRVVHTVPVRVLPAAIEVRLQPARSRYLRGVLDAGLLVQRGAGLREGPGWRVDPALLPYLRGTLWVGTETLVPLPLPAREQAGDPLLPEVVPVRGHNALFVDLFDVLDRPARVLVGGEPAPRRAHAGRLLAELANFWWNDGPPLPIGEELLGEHGQPMRLRLRFPLPFEPQELPQLRLSIAQGDIVASQVIPAANDESIVVFDLPFANWSVAAQLADKTREDFAEQLERKIPVRVETPVSSNAIELRVRTTRSTLQPVTLAQLGDVTGVLAAIQLLPVLAPSGPFEEPVPATAPPRAAFRPQVAVAVRNFTDFLLQAREMNCGEARAIATFAAAADERASPASFVHFDDPLGEKRLLAENLLPKRAWSGNSEQAVTGVSFYQAFTLCRLLGFAVGNDPDLFRLPLGCELELAAYAGAAWPASYGVAAHGGAVSMPRFLGAAEALARGDAPTAAMSRAAGDVITTAFGPDFVGLDFGVREWVFDVPDVSRADMLMAEWIKDHDWHLARVIDMSKGTAKPTPDPVGPLRTMGVVRGLALGELDGLLDGSGGRLDVSSLLVVPDTVPGVLRTEQLRRDGVDLLSKQTDPRLELIGFRVAGTPLTLARLRGRR